MKSGGSVCHLSGNLSDIWNLIFRAQNYNNIPRNNFQNSQNLHCMQPGTRLLFMHRSFLFNSLTLTQRHSNNRYIPSVPLTLRDTDSNSGSPEEKATLHPACFYNLLDPDINKRKNRYFNSIYLFNLTVQVLTPLNQHPIIIRMTNVLA